jgi:hypothetical protein
MKKLNPEERDNHLHLAAGLIDSGKDEEGRTEWIGTDRQWQTYKCLRDTSDENE